MKKRSSIRVALAACCAWFWTGVSSPAATPLITITSPTNGTVLSAPATFDIRASVAGGGNNVSQVEFLNGTNSLGIDTNNPFRITVNSLGAGTYVLWAVLTDNGGGKSSNSVTLIVNALPSISITAPADGSGLLAPATFALNADAFDSDGSVAKVQFFRATTAIGVVTNSPYSVTVKKLGVGSYDFSAKVTDNLGGTSTTNINLLVKNRPTVTFTAPAANARVTGTNTLVTGTAGDSSGIAAVHYSLNGGPFLAATGTNNWTATLTLPAGTNVLRARSTDLFGNVSLTNTRSCFQVVTSSLTLSVSGLGSIS
ncbi:MAG TPA: Ig-like domain-containing protein, partial [Candidatus Dormibacteraeota bacterium]|nr:Ig-like domain-containing protein [Candidatus Dormibacteraeota bacterium]